MDNTTKSEQGGCLQSLSGGFMAIGVIHLVALWSALADYIILAGVVIVLLASLIIKLIWNE